MCVFRGVQMGQLVWKWGVRSTKTRRHVVLGIRGLSVCLRGNSISVWVDLLDPHLLAHSIWPKPIECLYEWIPNALLIFVSVRFICISNTFRFKSSSRRPHNNAAISFGLGFLSQAHPQHRMMNSLDRCHTAENDNLPFGNQFLAPLCSLKLSQSISRRSTAPHFSLPPPSFCFCRAFNDKVRRGLCFYGNVLNQKSVAHYATPRERDAFCESCNKKLLCWGAGNSAQMVTCNYCWDSYLRAQNA